MVTIAEEAQLRKFAVAELRGSGNPLRRVAVDSFIAKGLMYSRGGVSLRLTDSGWASVGGREGMLARLGRRRR